MLTDILLHLGIQGHVLHAVKFLIQLLIVRILRLNKLLANFRLTTQQKTDIELLPSDIANSHVQVLIAGCDMYHLNPDLVDDTILFADVIAFVMIH